MERPGSGLPSEFESFDRADKREHWHTAFYYYAEHVRVLTNGIINHKKIYALIGLHGRFINHDNPTIRKRTAASLSRIVHTEQYVDDFRESYALDNQVFDRAAAEIVRGMREGGAFPLDYCVKHVRGPFWNDVERGIVNEQHVWRTDVSIARVKNEVQALLANDERSALASGQGDLEGRLECLLSSYLGILVFGHLREDQLNVLVQETPLGEDSAPIYEWARGTQACLVRYSGSLDKAVSRVWVIDGAAPFRIGRFTNCEVIDPCPNASRMHGTIFMREGAWYYQDCASLHGSRVVRGDEVVLDTKMDEGASCCELRYGDTIILAGESRYWFGAVYTAGNPTYRPNRGFAELSL